MKETQQQIAQILKEEGHVTEEQVQEALSVQKKEGGVLGNILVDLGYVSKDKVLNALGNQVGMDVVDLSQESIDNRAINMVNPSMANVYKIMPISYENGKLTVAMADPMNLSVLDDLRFMLDCDVEGAVADEKQVQDAIDRYYGEQTDSVDDLLGEFDGEKEMEEMQLQQQENEAIDINNLEEMANKPPVIKLLNLVLLQAIRDQASDIHFEPFESEFKIRYRVDGVLYEMNPPPLQLAVAVTSRIKVMADLDISETRLPQDGRIMLSIDGKPVDLRVSTLPTQFGESVVMRVLDRSVVDLDLDALGLREDEHETLTDLCTLPNGIIICTGPTGSGKSTTLYSCLNYLNDEESKIITTEDPVEYDLDGIIQTPIDPEIGVTYASCLRSILRQDPDIILVGEIRDLETARIAVQASLTGHVVFSTLHTNDAPSAVTRLIDLGVEPFLIAATFEAIIAQRLVRRICTNCKEPFEPDEEHLMQLDLSPRDVEGKQLMKGKGCDKCKGTGYRGQMAIFEIMLITDSIKKLIVEQASTDAIRRMARQQGMRTLRESGLLAIFDGLTTIEEVVDETMFAEQQ